MHQIVEKTLLDELHLHYLHEHQIAERDAVRVAGFLWVGLSTSSCSGRGAYRRHPIAKISRRPAPCAQAKEK
jgi:hypothetical protein